MKAKRLDTVTLRRTKILERDRKQKAVKILCRKKILGRDRKQRAWNNSLEDIVKRKKANRLE